MRSFIIALSQPALKVRLAQLIASNSNLCEEPVSTRIQRKRGACAKPIELIVEPDVRNTVLIIIRNYFYFHSHFPGRLWIERGALFTNRGCRSRTAAECRAVCEQVQCRDCRRQSGTAVNCCGLGLGWWGGVEVKDGVEYLKRMGGGTHRMKKTWDIGRELQRNIVG